MKIRARAFAAGMAFFAVACAGFSASAQRTGSMELGNKTYQQFCMVCHGPAGEGSPIGKPLNSVEAKIKSDSEILDVIKNGVQGTAMSAYGVGLTTEELFWVMLYIRKLQGEDRISGNNSSGNDLPPRPIISDAARRGEELFEEYAGCLQCHSYYTRGGIVGPDLSELAKRLTPEEIRAAVLKPSANINPGFGVKQIVLNDGTRAEGRYRMETARSIQISNADATLWRTYFKADIKQSRDGRKSMMPDDTAERLTVDEREDLFAFLATLK